MGDKNGGLIVGHSPAPAVAVVGGDSEVTGGGVDLGDSGADLAGDALRVHVSIIARVNTCVNTLRVDSPMNHTLVKRTNNTPWGRRVLVGCRTCGEQMDKPGDGGVA